MSFQRNRGLASLFLVLVVFGTLPLWASKKTIANTIDAGTFGVYVNGKRVASETFEITQTPELSVAKAELKIDGAKNAQTAELRLSSSGNLLRYEWKQKDEGSAVVEPKDEFLIEHVNIVQPAKSAEQPFVLPPSTMILDDYFFSQRQILLWRYLATQCKPKPGETGCPLVPAQFGVIVPRQQSSMQISVEYKGQQAVSIKGADQQLSRFDLTFDGNNWSVWMDQTYKIQKISIEADHTEVYRD